MRRGWSGGWGLSLIPSLVASVQRRHGLFGNQVPLFCGPFHYCLPNSPSPPHPHHDPRLLEHVPMFARRSHDRFVTTGRLPKQAAGGVPRDPQSASPGREGNHVHVQQAIMPMPSSRVGHCCVNGYLGLERACLLRIRAFLPRGASVFDVPSNSNLVSNVRVLLGFEL